MNNITKFYIIGYSISLIFGYDFTSRIASRDKLTLLNLNKNSHGFLFRRLAKLSPLSLLFSALFFTNPTINTYISTSLLHFVIIICYYIKFKLKDKIDYLTHILWALPVLLYPFFKNIKTENINKFYLLKITIFLIFYYFIHDRIYIKNST
jgi:hypothetical protein